MGDIGIRFGPDLENDVVIPRAPSTGDRGSQVRECTQKRIAFQARPTVDQASNKSGWRFPDQNEIGKCPIESASAWIMSPTYGASTVQDMCMFQFQRIRAQQVLLCVMRTKVTGKPLHGPLQHTLYGTLTEKTTSR